MRVKHSVLSFHVHKLPLVAFLKNQCIFAPQHKAFLPPFLHMQAMHVIILSSLPSLAYPTPKSFSCFLTISPPLLWHLFHLSRFHTWENINKSSLWVWLVPSTWWPSFLSIFLQMALRLVCTLFVGHISLIIHPWRGTCVDSVTWVLRNMPW